MFHSENLNVLIPGYIATNISRDFAYSLPDDIVKLLLLYSHIHSKQVILEHIRGNQYPYYRSKISIPIESINRYGYHLPKPDNNPQNTQRTRSEMTIEKNENNTKTPSNICFSSADRVCQNWLKWNCRLGWRCPDRHRGHRDLTLKPRPNAIIKTDLDFDLCVTLWDKLNLSTCITLNGCFKHTFAAYVDIRCVEFDQRVYGLRHRAIFMNQVSEETMIPDLTYKCYLNIIPLHKIPSIKEEIEFVWIIDRDLLKKSNYQLLSPILQLYDCRRLHGMDFYHLKLDGKCIELHCSNRKDKGRSAFRYRIEIEFDEMTTEWGGLAITKWSRDDSQRCFNIYPSNGCLSMQYYCGWLKRFVPTIRSIKLRFKPSLS